MKATDTLLKYSIAPYGYKKMIYFSYYWIRRNLKYSEIVILLFLMMTTLSMMPWNVWGDEIFTYTDKEGTMVISNIQPLENVNFNIWNSNGREDSALPRENINSNSGNGNSHQGSTNSRKNIRPSVRSSNSYIDLTSDERLHWGRDNALIDAQKRRYGQRKKVKDDNCLEAGRYEVQIKKIASNLYQDFDTRIIIKTMACVELAERDGSVLDWSGNSGELFFENTNKTCIVKKVYK
jgi:hypothetical protein